MATRSRDNVDDDAASSDGTLRLDKWLWYARVVKTRSLATDLVLTGKVRVNRLRVAKASQKVKPGDVITVSAHHRVRVLKVVACGERRGPAREAELLFEEMTPRHNGQGETGTLPTPGARQDQGGRSAIGADHAAGSACVPNGLTHGLQTQASEPSLPSGVPAHPFVGASRPRGSGRPTKRDRRAIEKLKP
ncbi:MAG: RNA-binding S4 domain-containing protein [Hyphomicrobiaceae bacterium]